MPVHPNPRDKEHAQEWARTVLRLPNFYVLDTETTGVDKIDEVIQIGIVDKAGKTVMNTLVKPTQPVPPEASAVHGITNEQLASAPTFDDLYVKLSSLLAGATLIAYNMDFDWRLLEQTSAKYGLPIFRVSKKHCAMKEYAKYYGAWNSTKKSYAWQKLANACKQQKITVQNAHDAVGDVLMTLALIRKMAN